MRSWQNLPTLVPVTGSSPEASSAPRATLAVAAVARRLGVAPATLRTWDRRYGLGPSDHQAGAHRRYTNVDVTRLLVMRRLTLEGVAPADAARMALATEVDESDEPVGLLSARSRRAPGPEDSFDVGARAAAAVAADPGPELSGDGAVRGLARAAQMLDPDECRRIIRQSVHTVGTVDTWQTIVAPVLGMVGDRWEITGEGIEVEHLLTECIADVMREVGRSMRSPRSARPVVLSAAEEEQHGLPVVVLAAALAERGIAVRMFGVRVPRHALAAAVRRVGPSVVLVYAHLPVGDVSQVTDLPRLRPAPLLLLGGPGWDGVATPAGAERVTDLPGTVQRIERALGY
jgi:DNA-binding transcriptional MerR regulator